MLRRPFVQIVLMALLLAAPVVGLVLGLTYWRRERQVQQQFQQEIASAAARHRIDPLLIKAVIWQESRFNRHAKGKAGEVGLMQIMELTGEEWAESQKVRDYSQEVLWDPARNIEAGAWYLAK